MPSRTGFVPHGRARGRPCWAWREMSLSSGPSGRVKYEASSAAVVVVVVVVATDGTFIVRTGSSYDREFAERYNETVQNEEAKVLHTFSLLLRIKLSGS